MIIFAIIKIHYLKWMLFENYYESFRLLNKNEKFDFQWWKLFYVTYVYLNKSIFYIYKCISIANEHKRNFVPRPPEIAEKSTTSWVIKACQVTSRLILHEIKFGLIEYIYWNK